MSRILLVDGNSIINRAFYGMNHARRLTDRSGRPTGAVYTFLTILLSVLQDENYTHLAICFDRKEKTFRHLKYSEYKAQRKPMPEELFVQLNILKELLHELNISSLELPGFEADDLIGTLSKMASKSEIFCDILSGDRDDHQLLDEYVSQIYPSKGSRIKITVDNLPEHFNGITARQVIDYKAIMGDSSDNIPGVKGLGEKAAAALLGQYDNLDSIYEHLDELKPAQRKKLEEGREMAFLSRELATIDRNVDLSSLIKDLSDLIYDGIKGMRARNSLMDLGFKSICDRLDFGEEQKPDKSYQVRAINNHIFIDLLTYRRKLTSEHNNSATNNSESIFIKHKDSKVFAALDYKEFLFVTIFDYDKSSTNFEKVKYELFNEAQTETLVAFDLKSELKFFDYYEDRKYFDPQIANYLLGNSDKPADAVTLWENLSSEKLSEDDNFKLDLFDISEKNLSDIVESILNFKSANEFEDRSKKHNIEVLVDEAMFDKTFMTEDDYHFILELYATYLASKYLKKEIITRDVKTLAYEIEMPLIAVLAKMETIGVLINKEHLKGLDKEFEASIKNLETEIFKEVGHDFNLKSPQQLSTVLFDELNYESGKKNSSGHYSTAADVLENLAKEHELVNKILEHRKLVKLQSTFIQGLLKDLDENDRIHTNFHQDLTNTGRLSSSNPNLQNIPIKSDEGIRIREAFIASKNHVLIDADYSQIELRLLAAMSEDENMLAAFNENRDIHGETARALFKNSLGEISHEERSHAKVVNFSIVYGVSEFGLSKTLDIPFGAARRYIYNFYLQYPMIKEFMDGIIKDAKDKNYVETMFGRRRYTSELKQGNFNQRKAAERAAMNMPIQGTAADLMKLAMVKVSRRFKEEKLEADILLQVHDEILLEVPCEEAEQAMAILKETMESVAKLRVPLLVEAGIADNWAKAH